MVTKKKRLALLVGQAFAATALISGSVNSFGQAVERVEITGSNIPRVQTETASPVQVITREEIEKSGKATVAEYLQTLAVDNQGSVPMSFGNGFAPGASGISLRGLGASSTLVLMNGRRVAPYGQADDGQKVFSDLSIIPLEAVDRIEILKDGASAIYGSDAIAGVVNIIMRKDFTGTVATASIGTSRYRDGDQKRASVTMGFGNLASDRFNFFFNVEAFKADQVFARDRNREHIGNGDVRAYGYDQYTQFMAGYLLPNPGGAGNASSSPAGNIRNPATLQYQSLPGCAQFSRLTPQDPEGGCLWEVGRFRSLLPSDETINVFGRGTWQFLPNVQGYAELSYVTKKTEFQTNPSGVSGSWGFPGGAVNASAGAGAVGLGATHPQNPFGAFARLRYSAFDVGPRVNNTDNEFRRFVVGLKGRGFGWDYDAALLHSETDLVSVRRGFLRYSVVRDFLLGTNVTGLNPALAFWRIGADAGLNPQSLYALISPTIQAKSTSKMQILDLKGSRELMQLAGGPLSLAVGGEVRREETKLEPQTFTDRGDIIGLGFSAYDGKKDIKSLYAELLAPVHKAVELSGAVRWDDYPGISASITPKVGAKWTPVKQFALRGTYSEGFRAPNIPESSAGGLAAFTTTPDPLRCPGGVPAAGGGTAADCNVSVAIITTGNASLKPEKSSGTTFGAVWDPFPTTSIALDFWNIKRSNEINQMTVGQAVAGGGTVLRSDNNLIGVPNSGSLLAVSAPYLNSASTKINGVDLDVRQRFNLAEHGSLTFDLKWTHIGSFRRIEPDGTSFQFAGTHGNCDVTNCMGTPKDRINFGTTWERGEWRVTAVVNFRGAMKNVAFDGDGCANHFADGSDAPTDCKLKSFHTVDLSFRWKPYKNTEIFGSIQNLFDKVAPLDPLTYGAINYNPLDISGAIGRTYNVGLKYKFN